jgi:hypothetical protein
MGITLLSLGGLLAPLQNLVSWFTPAPCRAAVPQVRPAAVRPFPSRTCAPRAAASAGRHDRLLRPLRVVRVVDGASAPAGAGRMFMSGRMADVCAELDRLAALEAAAG